MAWRIILYIVKNWLGFFLLIRHLIVCKFCMRCLYAHSKSFSIFETMRLGSMDPSSVASDEECVRVLMCRLMTPSWRISLPTRTRTTYTETTSIIWLNIWTNLSSRHAAPSWKPPDQWQLHCYWQLQQQRQLHHRPLCSLQHQVRRSHRGHHGLCGQHQRQPELQHRRCHFVKLESAKHRGRLKVFSKYQDTLRIAGSICWCNSCLYYVVLCLIVRWLFLF